MVGVNVNIVPLAGGYAVAVNGIIATDAMSLEEAEQVQAETLRRIRAEQKRSEREELRLAFGRLGER